jgi:DNA primase
LWQLRAEPAVVIVEGESDCHTLWFHGINAVGLPGAVMWNETRDAPHLSAFETIYAVVEPDQGGEAMLRWISKSALRDRIRLVRLSGFKDPSAMHVADPTHFRSGGLRR